MKRHLLTLLALLCIVLFAQPALAYFKDGEAAPDFELEDVDGHKVKLSDFSGRIVILKLATTWCPTCKEQTGEIQEAAEELNAADVVVLTVFLQDTREMVTDYLPKENKVESFVPLLDDGQAREAYNVYLIPRLLIIDQQQKVQRDGGLITAYDLKKRIQRLTEK